MIFLTSLEDLLNKKIKLIDNTNGQIIQIISNNEIIFENLTKNIYKLYMGKELIAVLDLV